MNDHLNPLFAQILNAAASRPDTTPAGAVPVPASLPNGPRNLCLAPGCDNPPAPNSGWCSRACWWRDEGSMNEGRRYS